MSKILVKNTTELPKFLVGPDGDEVQLQPYSQGYVYESYTNGVIPKGVIVVGNKKTAPVVPTTTVSRDLPKVDQSDTDFGKSTKYKR